MTGRWRVVARKNQGRTQREDTRYLPIWPYARCVLEAFQASAGRRAPDAPLCAAEGRRQRAGQPVAIQNVRVLYRKATERATELLDEWQVEHQLDHKRVVPRCWRTTYASARVQTLDHGAPVAPGTVRVEMGHKSLYIPTRVYERVGDVRARREVVEYRRPDGRLPGEALSGRCWAPGSTRSWAPARPGRRSGSWGSWGPNCDNGPWHRPRTNRPLSGTKARKLLQPCTLRSSWGGT